MRTNYKRLRNIILKGYTGIELDNARFKGFVVIADGGTECENRVRIELVDYYGSFKNECGIHLKLTENIEHDLIDSLETAFKDLFPVIYIYQAKRPTVERRERLKASVLKWVEAIKAAGHAYGAYSLNKPFADVVETIDSMDEVQLEATLALMSACYQKCGQDSRDFRASLKVVQGE